MSWEKEQRAKRTKRWIAHAQVISAVLYDAEQAVHERIENEIEDFECDEWRDGYPPRPTDHPLFQVALLLEQAGGLVDERLEALQEEQT